METTEQKLARLEAENAALKAKTAPKRLTFKVSEKGCISVYGLRSKFPVSLYREEMERLLAATPEIKAFIAANAHKLPTKEE